MKNHLLYQLIVPEILLLGFWSFDVKPFFFFFCHNVSGRYIVKLQYHPINFRTFSYAYLAGKENKENKIERNKLSQCINHGMCAQNDCKQFMGFHSILHHMLFFVNEKINLFTWFDMNNASFNND